MLAQVPMEKAVAPPWKVNGRRLQMEMVFLIVIGPDLYYCTVYVPHHHLVEGDSGIQCHRSDSDHTKHSPNRS